MAYVCADSYDKAQRAALVTAEGWPRTHLTAWRQKAKNPEDVNKHMTVAAADCFIWQTLVYIYTYI